jgi:hypothetical protein
MSPAVLEPPGEPEGNKPILPSFFRVKDVGGAPGSQPPPLAPLQEIGPAVEARAAAEAAVTTPSEIAVRGKRTDLAEGVGFRYRVGFDGSGNLVVEKWTESGTKTTAVFS